MITWLAGVCFCAHRVLSYESAYKEVGFPLSGWPEQNVVTRSHSIPTIVMLAHPHCPCTRASIDELAEIMAHAQGKVSAVVLFLQPETMPRGWSKTDLWRKAAAIPGVTTLLDEGGTTARKFHGDTSGQTFLFHPDGHLLFSGGITASRGHAGENVGRTAILSIVHGGSAIRTVTPVFGCRLYVPSAKTVAKLCSNEKSCPIN